MLVFANYYRNFIPDFATIATHLAALTKKDTVFHWGSTEQAAVDKLKSSFSRVIRVIRVNKVIIIRVIRVIIIRRQITTTH